MGATTSSDDLFGDIEQNETTTMMDSSGSEVVTTITTVAGTDVTPQAEMSSETTTSLAVNLGAIQKWYLCILLNLLQVTIMREKTLYILKRILFYS